MTVIVLFSDCRMIMFSKIASHVCTHTHKHTQYTYSHLHILKCHIHYQIIPLPTCGQREDLSHYWLWNLTAQPDTRLNRRDDAFFGLFICLWFSIQDKPWNKFQVCFERTPGYKSYTAFSYYSKHKTTEITNRHVCLPSLPTPSTHADTKRKSKRKRRIRETDLSAVSIY